MRREEKGLNNLKFGDCFGRFQSDGAARMAMKGLNMFIGRPDSPIRSLRIPFKKKKKKLRKKKNGMQRERIGLSGRPINMFNPFIAILAEKRRKKKKKKKITGAVCSSDVWAQNLKTGPSRLRGKASPTTTGLIPSFPSALARSWGHERSCRGRDPNSGDSSLTIN